MTADPATATKHTPVGQSSPAVIQSEGQRLLLEVKLSLQSIAHELKVRSPQSVHDWKVGARMPHPAARARMQYVYGIPSHAWGQRPAPPGGTPLDAPAALTAPPASVAPPVRAAVAPVLLADTFDVTSSPTALEDCLALLAVIRSDRGQPNLLASERVKLAAAETRILALRSRLELAAELAESRYVAQHPAWQRLRRALVAALEPYPDAAKAVSDAIAFIEP